MKDVRMKDVRLNITKKLILGFALILMVSLLLISIVDYVIAKMELNRSNEILLKNAIETSLYVIDKNYNYTIGKEPLMTEEEGKNTAISTIKEFVVGSHESVVNTTDATSKATAIPEGNEPVLSLGENGYFFIIDSQGNIVYHPFLQENLLSLESNDGRFVVQEMIELAKNGGGEMHYSLSKNASQFSERRTVYTKYFEQWDWVVAAVIYDSDLFRGPERIFQVNLISFVIILVVALGIITVIARRITAPIKKITKVLTQVSEGDLTVDKIEIKTKDETRLLGESANHLIKRFREIANSLTESSGKLIDFSAKLMDTYDKAERVSEAIAESSLQIEQASELQVREIFEGVSKMDRLSEDIRKTAHESKKASLVAAETLKLKDDGIISVEGLKEASIENSQTSGQLEHIIYDMNEHMKAIDTIVTTIAEIADQTNLLALNASIEAARVGEQGKGFAVVAGEIRSLANETAKAVESISTMVIDFQKQSQDAVTYVKKNVMSVSKIDESVKTTEDTFHRIATNLNEVVEEINSITDYNLSIDEKKDSLSKLLKDLSEMTQEVSNSIEEVTSSSNEHKQAMHEVTESVSLLHEMAKHLEDAVSTFQL